MREAPQFRIVPHGCIVWNYALGFRKDSEFLGCVAMLADCLQVIFRAGTHPNN